MSIDDFVAEDIDVGDDQDEICEGVDSDEPDGSATTSLANYSATASSSTKARAKAKGAGKQQKGRPAKSKAGMKWCSACNRTLPLDKFPSGSAHCANDRQAVQNIAHAARGQNQHEWWEETLKDTKKLQKVVKAYHQQCPRLEGKKRAPFKVLAYVEYCRQEELLIKDTEMEMMDLRQFVAWQGKAKNGAMDAEEARTLFFQLLEQPMTITDELGAHERYRSRIAVKRRDVIIRREQEVRGRGYDLKEKEVKKATVDDVDKAESRVQRGSVVRGASALSRDDLAQAMVKAGGALAGSGSGAASSLGAEAKAMAQIGNVKELVSASEDEQDDVDPGDEEADEVGDMPHKSPHAKKRKMGSDIASEAGSATKKRKETDSEWLDHGKVMAAINTHQTWMRATAKTLHDTLEAVKDVRNSVTEDVRGSVANELKLLDNRYLALRLVLGQERLGPYCRSGFQACQTSLMGPPRLWHRSDCHDVCTQDSLARRCSTFGLLDMPTCRGVSTWHANL